MIFVTLGTISYPFKRLAVFINSYAKEYPNEKIIIQQGYTRGFIKLRNMELNRFLTVTEMVKKIKSARLVIAHGGEGSIYTILKYSKNKPIVFPRIPTFGEHVDDQQVKAGKFLVDNNLAHVFTEMPIGPLPCSKNLSKTIKSCENVVEIIKILDSFVDDNY